ncbi:MAG TPA: carbohydrate kinase family protein [Lachnospiraceae bacterium]|nr:carbohydrate kinase family protein [Lachnospiraceae bacterium]
MKKFAVAGIIQLETIVKVESIPIEYTPVVTKPDSIFTNVGGDAYNECLALRALGDEVRFFTVTGEDNTDMVLKDTLVSGADYVYPALSATPSAVILYDSDRRQQIFEDIKNVRDIEFPIEPFKKNIADVDCVVLANANFCRPLAKAAKDAGKTLAINFRGFTEDKYEFNKDLMELADIIYLSDDNIVTEPDEFVRKVANAHKAKIIILGQGSSGLTIYSRNDDLLAHYKPVKTTEIVNTAGAGNSLFSCFLHCYVESADAVHSIKNALLFASYKIGHMGTSHGFLSEEELERWYHLIWG